jgi:uncharacterized membrane protein YozB (DUF420 family)
MVFGYSAPAVGTGMSVLSLVIVIALVGSLMLPKKLHYVFNGIVLILMGVMPMMYNARIISINIESMAIVQYMLTFIIVVAGRELIKEGIKEENKMMKWASILVGVFIITFTTIPALYAMGAIGFTMPNFPPELNYGLYITAGIFMLVGVFTLAKKGI